ncbi:hypothetical protein DYB32_001885 [Aphanomyces invadans]|uniref:G-patch domain-containing protein n=1 Tax=Aphanomyces invadans TaxID=157072 RepID=A0A418B7R7_9STRA|nr:hypothetical protein DYB32_001885 [Aphanomyces invadans]
MECYKCGAPKSEYAVEVPRQSPDPMAAHPSCILAVRSLPLEAQEEDVSRFFHSLDDCHATAALLAIGSEFYYANALVRLSYSNEMVAPRVLGTNQSRTRSTFQRHVINGIYLGPNAQALAHSAVEAAQWSLSNPYQNTSDLDVNDLLASAAAAVPTTPQVPKKDFPLSFEEAGGSFVFVSENGNSSLPFCLKRTVFFKLTMPVPWGILGLYYHSDSMFFYDPTSKVYYNSFLGTYHVIDPTTKNSFLPYQVPLPVDDAVGAPDPPKKDASKHGSKKKATAISFGIKPTYTRRFNSAAQLRKHEQLSDLHKQNLAKAKQTQQSLRVRESPKEALLPRVEEPAMEAVEVARVDKPLDDQSNIGGKMLKMMGWKSGEGLGKAGSGITAPVAAVGKTSGDTSGLGIPELGLTG